MESAHFIPEPVEGKATPRQRPSGLSRVGAVLEVVTALAFGTVLGRWVQTLLGVPGWKPAQAEALANGIVDYWHLAWLATVEQILKYGFLILGAYLIGRWHRGRPLQAYGVTRRRASTAELARIGVVLWAATGLLPTLLQLGARTWPWLGVGPDHWAIFPDVWSWGFIAYMAAASFLGFAHALQHNAHIRVSLLLNAVGPGVRRIINIWCFAIATATQSTTAEMIDQKKSC